MFVDDADDVDEDDDDVDKGEKFNEDLIKTLKVKNLKLLNKHDMRVEVVRAITNLSKIKYF